MYRPKYIQSMASSALLAIAPIQNEPEMNNYEYLEKLFSKYTTEQFEESCCGASFTAHWHTPIETNDYYSLQYRVFENHDSIFTVDYYHEGNPKVIQVEGISHRDAFRLAEIGRILCLDTLLSTFDRLEKRSFRHTEFITTLVPSETG